MSPTPSLRFIPVAEIPAADIPVADIPVAEIGARTCADYGFETPPIAADAWTTERVDTDSHQPWGVPLTERHPPTAGATGVLMALASGVSYAWIGFQLILALTVAVARISADGPAFAIESGSMEPKVSVGSVVVTRTASYSELEPSDIIAFADPAHPGRIVTHRVVETTGGAVKTKGDANAEPDSTLVPPQSILGKVFIVIPGVAKPVVWIQHGAVGPLSIWMLSCLAALVCIHAERSRGRPIEVRPARTAPVGANDDELACAGGRAAWL